MRVVRGMWSLLAMLVVVAFLLPAAAALGAEAAVAMDPPVWYGDVRLWELVVSIVVVVWGILKAKYNLEARWGVELTELLEMGAQKAYDEFVRDAKMKAPNGKLSAAQIREARDRAWVAAKEYARERGIDLAKKVAAEKVPLLITQVVNKLKRS